jgi:uncharacterized membrane protein YphA (DoxX/SURF4 family)
MRDRVRAFFCAATDPLNLAVLRLAVFAWLIRSLSGADFVRYTRIPAELRVVPPGYSAFFHLIPWNETWVITTHAVALLACVWALLGLFTRCAALLACLCLMYLLGLPEFFGKIDHVHHHFVWITALLAASRSGDALSIDALRAAVRRADRGEATDPPGPSTAYALPLRVVWLLIGVAYFFPGLAKLRAGPYWVLSDNLKNLMHRFWASKDFLPAVRIDRYPLLYRSAAAATVLFELGFLPALFFPWLRRLAVAGGVAFHLLNVVYLRIAFYGLLICYVGFIDWAALLAAAGRRLFGDRLVIAYDGQRGACRRRVAVLRTVDVLRAIEWWDTSLRGAPPGHAAATPLGHATGLSVTLPDRTAAHGRAFVRVLTRLPLALPLLPVVWWIARSGALPAEAPPAVRRADRPASAVGAALVGSLLLAANLYCGVFEVDSWPFGVYPRFAGFAGPEYTALEVVVRDAAGRTRPVDTGLRPASLLRLLEAAGSDRAIRLAALQEYLARYHVRLAPGESVQVYEITRSTLPEDRWREPLRRKLLSQLGPYP